MRLVSAEINQYDTARFREITALLTGVIVALVLSLIGTHSAFGSSLNPSKSNNELLTKSGKINPASDLLASSKAEMMLNPRKALQLASAAEQIVNDRNPVDKTQLAEILWLKGEAHLRLNEIAQAKADAGKAFAILPKKGPSKLLGDILVTEGGVGAASGDVSSSLYNYQKAYHVFYRVNETRSETIALLNIAYLYTEAEDYQRSLKYYAQALEIYKADPNLSISIYNNQGVALTQMGKFAQGIERYRRALALVRKVSSPALETQILRNLARAQLSKGDLAEAGATIDKGFALAKGDEARAARVQFSIVAAQLALRTGNLPKADKLLSGVFAEVTRDGDDALALRDAHETAYEVYKKLGRNDIALQHLEALKRLDDQTASLAASANTALMAARFDYTNQNLKIAQLQAQDLRRKITYERAHARNMRIVFIAAGGTTLVIIVMLVFGIVTIRRSRNEERAAKNDLAETNTALAKALAAKTEFLATTSHEIRTPLNGILGMTQVMLADRGLGDEMRDRLGVVHSAGVTMRALVDDILDVAKMETGNMTIEHAPMDVCEVLRDVARVWQDQARARGLDFVLSLDDCPAFVIGDAARLRQVVFNLLSNALKFTEAGRITLHGWTAHQPDGARVRIDVSDTGIGIASDKLEEVFESFRQADTSTTRRFGGTGLGLAICRNLTRAMGGEVGVVSVLGEGTTFTIDLPLVVSTHAAQNCPIEPDRREALLIVDRNPISRSMLRALLEERAGAVTFAESLAEAVDHITAGGIAFVLIDEATARADGDDWLAKIGQIVSAAGDVAHTALLCREPEATELQSLRATGLGQVIIKPIAGPTLRDIVYPIDETNRSNPHLVSDAA